jgi:hypothetical protein
MRDRSAGGYVPHVELSITDFGPVTPPPADPLDHWTRAVASAVEPCLIIDKNNVIIAISPSCVAMLGMKTSPVGESLRDGPLRLIDFSAGAGTLSRDEMRTVPPVLAVASGRLARGLIRVEYDGATYTLDAIATPIGPPDIVSGSLTFFSPV